MLVPLWYLHKSKHTDLTYGVLSWHESADTVLMLQTKTSKLILEIPIKKGYLKEDIYFFFYYYCFFSETSTNASECLAKMGEAVLTNQEVLNAFVVKDIKANSVKKVRQRSSRCSKNM